MAKVQFRGTGRRKSSVARVRLVPGTGNITVNKKPLDDYIALEIVNLSRLPVAKANLTLSLP